VGRVLKCLTGLSVAFFTGIALGVVYAYSSPDKAGEFVMRLTREIGPLSSDTFQNFVRIFVHNSWVALLVLLSGLFFGIGPWVMVTFNGIVVGIVSGFLAWNGFSLKRLIFGLIPHGIFEIPAFLLAGAAGIEWYRNIREGNPKDGFERGLRRALKLYLLTLGLLLVAAFVETYVTPKIAGLG